MKAIPTRYRGYHFRSRLEARWGVFFDALGVEWEYEPEGFEMPDGTRYLPDFFLRERALFLEIKPNAALTRQEAQTIFSFAQSLTGELENGGILVLRGDPGAFSGFLFGAFDGEAKCGPVSAVAVAELIGAVTHRSLENAISAARSARFEHGQSGAT